jgi:hypothetical protein
MTDPAPIRVQNWNQLQDLLFADSWDAEIDRYRSRCAFRGLSDARYPLETTLTRLGGAFVELERHLLRNFRKYAHRNVVERDSVWNWLAVAQHHGLPTRLMDWTYSPLVAIHFALTNLENYHTDGAVWAVNYVQTHQLLPDKLKQGLAREGANVFTVEMLAELVPSLAELPRMAARPFVIFFEPPSIDDRIVNQFAFFSTLSEPAARMDHWLARNPAIWRKIIIPAHLKWEFRDRLDQANITERVLFPGLDGLSKWLMRHYTVKTLHHPKPAP